MPLSLTRARRGRAARSPAAVLHPHALLICLPPHLPLAPCHPAPQVAFLVTFPALTVAAFDLTMQQQFKADTAAAAAAATGFPLGELASAVGSTAVRLNCAAALPTALRRHCWRPPG